jgi:hypothetical protein
MTNLFAVLSALTDSEIATVVGAGHDGMFAGAICSEAAWRDRRANYDQYASTIAYESYCTSREPNSWAGRVEHGLSHEQYGSVTTLANKPWHRFVNGQSPMPAR